MDQENIQVVPGQTFEVTLDETSSSGYLWRAGFVPDGIELAETVFDPPSWQSPVGAGGHRRFVFQALYPGAFTLRFDLRREWEDKPLQHHVVRVEVSESNR